MGRKDHRRPLRYLLDILDSNGALFLQGIYYVGVVHNLVLYIHGSAVLFQGQLDHVYRSDDAGAESSGETYVDLHGAPPIMQVAYRKDFITSSVDVLDRQV